MLFTRSSQIIVLQQLRELFERPALDAESEERLRMCDASMKYLSAVPPVTSSTSRDVRAGGDRRGGSPTPTVAAATRRAGVAEAGGDCGGVDRRPCHSRGTSCPSSLADDLSDPATLLPPDGSDPSPLAPQVQHASTAARDGRGRTVFGCERRLLVTRGRRSLEAARGGPRTVGPASDRRLPPLKPRGLHDEGTRLL